MRGAGTPDVPKRRTRGLPVASSPEPLSEVEACCRQAGLRLTTARREVLEVLRAHQGPMSAYALIQALSERRRRKVSPPTVYRALDALRDHGLIARIASRNAFLARRSPVERDAALIYLCIQCGSAREVRDPTVARRVAIDATQLHFRVAREIHEVEGVCGDCVDAAAVTPSAGTRPSAPGGSR
jgi:Fur family zinc uptake transcriptional regulator